MNETKTGWADKLFAWFSKDVKTTGLVLLTLLSFFLLRRGDKLEAENKKLQEDKTEITTAGLERVIKEVEKRQDPRFKAMENKLDTVRQVTDSMGEKVNTTTGIVQGVIGDIKTSLKNNKRK